MELRTAVDNLYLYDPQFEPAADKFLREVGGSSASRPIKSWTDVTDVMKSYSLVKLLIFDTHGKPGAVSLPDSSHVDGVDFMLLSANPTFLKSQARILFLGCNIGEGSLGDRFMDEAGRYLLRGKGGIVGATTVPNLVFQLGPFASESYMVPLSFGRLKVKRYDASGAQVGSRTVDRHGFRR
jgi:hypothetical protein